MRAHISRKLWKVQHVYLFYLQETSARASPALDNKKRSNNLATKNQSPLTKSRKMNCNVVHVHTKLAVALIYCRHKCNHSIHSIHLVRWAAKQDITFHVRLQVLTAASIKIRVFWNVMPCSLIGVDRRFRGAYCLHHQGNGWRQYAPLKCWSTPMRLHRATSQKTLNFISFHVYWGHKFNTTTDSTHITTKPVTWAAMQ
jgi:hypothetical protein